jgi:hypothetical protein
VVSALEDTAAHFEQARLRFEATGRTPASSTRGRTTATAGPTCASGPTSSSASCSSRTAAAPASSSSRMR